jgi:hypothetical protein
VNVVKNNARLKDRFKRLILWAGLFVILLLTGLSIYGAFIGADNAQALFNSIPLSVYWVVFTLLLLTAIALFRRLVHLRGLLMMHIGGVLILIGALWGSQAGFKIQDAAMNTDTIRTGQMVLYEGMSGDAVDTEHGEIKTLPFAVRLVDFRMEYYQPGLLIIQTSPNSTAIVPAETGLKYMLGDDSGSVEIIRRFEHFKIILQDDKRIAIDDPCNDPNPALELRLTTPDGSEATRYAFERFPGHTRPGDTFQFRYHRMVRDFISDLEIVKDTAVLVRKSIEVNKPLHFGGYMFYQQSYDDEAGRFSVLKVTNDRGLWIVFMGYGVLCGGAFWHLWFRHLVRSTVLRAD